MISRYYARSIKSLCDAHMVRSKNLFASLRVLEDMCAGAVKEQFHFVCIELAWKRENVSKMLKLI